MHYVVSLLSTNTFQNGELFRPVSQRVQMNFIFNDNIRILCLSCNVTKVGKLVRFKQKGQKQASFLAFHKCCLPRKGGGLKGMINKYKHMNKTTCIAECDTLGHSLKQVHIIIFILQSVHLLYKYAIRIIFCFIRTRWIMNFIFNDNIRILCLSCNVKKVGRLVRFKQKGQKQASFLAFHKCCQIWLYQRQYNCYMAIPKTV
jgi:uncharacterized membrane protein